MSEAAIAALQEIGCALKIENDGRVWSLYASHIVFTSDDARYASELRGLRELVLFDCAHDDSIWPTLACLPDLERLRLVGRNPKEPIGNDELLPAEMFDPRPLRWLGVSDNGSHFLRSVPMLKSLDLTCTEIGDATLGRVRHLRLLEKLTLMRTRITDSGGALSALGKLKWLSVAYTKVGDGWVARTNGLTGLTTLELEGTEITNTALAHVSRLSALQVLSLHNTDVSEEGLGQLSALKRLETLYAGGPITAVGARSLKCLPALRYLYIGYSNKGRDMTPAEYEWLRSELPNVVIE